jgi:hypothetical protein
MAEMPAPPAGRGREGTALGCAAGTLTVLVGILVCAGLVLMGCAHTVTSTLQGGGNDDTTPVAVAGSAVLRTDGITLLYEDPTGPCRSPKLTATESDAQVTLTLTESDLGLVNCVRFPRADPLMVRLAAPLGTRTLLDALSHRVVPVFTERQALIPHRLPGWQPGPNQVTLGTLLPGFGGGDAAVLVQYFTRTTYGLAPAWMAVVEVAHGGWHSPTGQPTVPITVRGQPGQATDGLIVWSENGYTVAVTGAENPAAPAGSASLPSALPRTDLVVIADSLGGQP